MQQQASTINAVIDIGSNTIEVLIARCSPNSVDIIEHQTTMARLGESVDDKGEISSDKFELALMAVHKYQKLAQEHGAEEILAIATEALREARNSQDFINAIKRETGVEVQLISGYSEAVLDFLGATYHYDTFSNVGVLDVGGGSTEIVAAKNDRITWLTSIPIGSGALHDRYLPSDPPKYGEMEAARSYLASQLQMIDISEPPSDLIVTGSSASALLNLARTAFKLEEQNDHLSFEDLALCEGLLCALPSEEIAERYQQRIERARILPAGGLIIQAVMQYLHLKEICVSSHGVREGALLAHARYGRQWLEEINSIASTRGVSQGERNSQDIQEAQQQPFAEFGRETLTKYAQKFLKWPDDVRKQEDIEAVHKMRVASRRLRATLDAFESCTDPTAFKKINTRVKKLADALGTVRDADVMIAGLHSYMQEIASEERAGVQWLIDRLHSYHEQEEQVLNVELQNLDEDAIDKLVNNSIPKGAARNGKS
jgi:exopolyphosphatase / guanosine-5'-triphosphate,3'-diphosphate pyrophosphatase